MRNKPRDSLALEEIGYFDAMSLEAAGDPAPARVADASSIGEDASE